MSKDTLVSAILSNDIFQLNADVKLIQHLTDEDVLEDHILDIRGSLAELANKLYLSLIHI